MWDCQGLAEALSENGFRMFNLFGASVWPPNRQNPPWGDRKSIFEHIAEHIDPRYPVGLPEEGYRLPDEPPSDPGTLTYAPGMGDGAFGHHGSEPEVNERVAALHAALVAACASASDRNVRSLYGLISNGSALEVIDPLVGRILETQAPDADRLREIARWFTTQAADREAVKISMALLGLLRGRDDSEVFLTLGRHDEFTLYAAVAVANNEAYGEEVLWALARSAEGWGRIGAVERLADTTSPEIKDWLLRDGFRNSIMHEYLACICARAGELHRALEIEEIDAELFGAAVELVDALISGEGGPAEGLGDYEHGCAAVKGLLARFEGRPSSPYHFWVLCRLRDRVGEHLSGEGRLKHDWTEPDAEAIVRRIDDLLAGRDWRGVIAGALNAGDRQEFWYASRAAGKLGIDPWPHFLARTKAGEEYWWDLMQTSDGDRIDKVLSLASESLDLDAIATGPGDHLGLGAAYASHRALDFILQDLGGFPGKGWAFIEAGLQSPVVRNRNMALRALSAWGRANWPDEAERALLGSKDAEPESDVRRKIENVLAGRSLD